MSETRCDTCGKELQVGEFPFCGGRNNHGFPLTGLKQMGDEIVGGFWQENFGPTPEYFDSKKAMARRAKELGLVSFVRHVGDQGSDKSSKTSRWV